MPGEPLMCVWQAVLAKDIFPESGVKRATVMSVVENFEDIQCIRYTERRFKEVFTESKVDFDKFTDYVQNSLRAPSVPMPLVLEPIELKCWKMASDTYKSEALNSDDIFKMWTIFNRVCDQGSYPPMISKQQSHYLFERIANNIHKTWGSSETIPEAGWTFQEMIDTLDRSFFTVTSTALVRQCIEDINSWLVREIMKIGWLYKRTRKNANWTNWLKRWFIMTPGHLMYYETDKQKVQKGNVVIDAQTKVESMEDYKSLLSKMHNRFKVTNEPSLEIELCADTVVEKDSWIALIRQNVEAMKAGITPQMRLLQERAKMSKERRKESLQETEEKLDVAQNMARKGSRRILDESLSKEPTPKAQIKKPTNAPPPAPPSITDPDGVYDNNVFEMQRDKIRAVFLKIDKDGNGRIDNDEFAAFVHGLGARLERREIDLIFTTVDKDKNKYICFEEFVDYFMNFVMEKSEDSATEAKLRAAFLRADRDGSGAVNFREFSEYAYSRRRTMAIDKLMSSFDALDTEGKGEIQFEEFKKFFQNEPGFMEMEDSFMAMEGERSKSGNLEDFLKGTYEDADVSDLASYLKSRWVKFASFKRYGEMGDLVMKGGSGMVDDVIPGHYNLVDLACFNDLPPIEPKKVVVKGVQWVPSSVPGRSGRAIFPDNFDGIIPTEIATNEHLAYYGSSLADGNQLKISLLYRHGIQDFTYENNYLEGYVTAAKALGGAGIERHDFAHLDCPLEEDSGFFIMAKFEEGDMHITGFKVPTRHTIYVPGGVIHCNDYLKGTWRTMLSDEADIEHVQLVKMQRQGNMEQYEHFAFSFKPLK